MDEAPSNDQPLQEVPEAGSAEAEVTSGRDPFWDNVKAICVFFVLCLHCLTGGSMAMGARGAGGGDAGGGGNHTDDGKGKAMQAIVDNMGLPLLAFLTGTIGVMSVCVMPGFAYVSGHLSKKEITPRRARNLFQMGVTCIFCQGIQSLFSLLAKKSLPITFYGGMGVQWFLICLLFWRVTLPFWLLLRRPLAVSVVLGTLVLFSDANNSMFHEFFTFLPFFLAGHLTSHEAMQRHLQKRSGLRSRFLFVALVLCVGALCTLVTAWQPKIGEVLMGFVGVTYSCFMADYQQACVQWWAPVLHLLYYLAAVPIIPAFLAAVPREKVWGLTHAGAFSMYIYLLHVFFLVPAIIILSQLKGPVVVPASFLCAFAMWSLLGTGCGRICCAWCIEPKIDRYVQPWFLEDGEQPEGGQPTPVQDEAPRAECMPAAS